jgi:cobalt-zinc-cadmium efflux system membrane fusion protein
MLRARVLVFIIIFILPLLIAAAGRGDTPSPPSSPAITAASDAAMCPEHGVLEAVCTKCNPRLAAVFQAKGDWCREHGFPESVCPKCKPDRNGRPAVGVGTAAGESTRIRFVSGEVAPAVGITTVRPGRRVAPPLVTAPARVEHDPSRSAIVNARAAGVVRAVHVTIGSRVAAGDPLVTIESATVGADRSRLESARKRASVAAAAVARQRRLVTAGVLAVKDLQASEQELAAAKAEVGALAASTGLVDRSTARSYDLTAPVAGTVVDRTATPGQLVDAGHPLLRIVDTTVVWAVIDVPELEIGRIAVGQAVSLAVEVLPGRTWRGKIASLAPEVDARTRTVAARMPLANPDGALRANMLGVGTVEVGAARPALLVPRSAVQRVREGWMVFERLSPDRFAGKAIRIEDSDADPVAVLSGLGEQDEVVTTGSFLLKTEVLKESIGAGCCEADARK